MTLERLSHCVAAMNPQKKPYFTPSHFHAPVDSDLFCSRYRMADRPELYMWGDGMEGTGGNTSSDVSHHMDNNTDHGNDTSWASHLKSPWSMSRPPMPAHSHPGPHGGHGPALFPSHPAHLSQPSTPGPPRIHPDGLPSLPIGGGSGMPGTPTPTSMSNATSLVVPQPMKARTTIKTYHCRMCDQEFHNKSEMTRHSKDIHGMEEKSHKCPKCFKSFPTSQQLAQHSLVHTNIRKFHCQYCEKTFKQLSHVQQHQRIHTGERPYKCTVESCGKAFAQLANLQQHLKNHDVRSTSSDKKPYSCSTCDRRFATEASLNHHVSKVCCVHIVKPSLALASPTHTLPQPLASSNTASMVANYIQSPLSPVPYSYAGIDLRMLGALAASNVLQSAAHSANRMEHMLPPNDIKKEPVDSPRAFTNGSSDNMSTSDEERENQTEFAAKSHDLPPQTHDMYSQPHDLSYQRPPEEAHDISVMRESHSHREPEHPTSSATGRLMELSRKDLNLLRASSDKLYSFPTQVPPLNSALYTDKPLPP